MRKSCFSEVSFCFTYEESLGIAFSFTSSKRVISFQRIMSKIRPVFSGSCRIRLGRQDDKTHSILQNSINYIIKEV